MKGLDDSNQGILYFIESLLSDMISHFFQIMGFN